MDTVNIHDLNIPDPESPSGSFTEPLPVDDGFEQFKINDGAASSNPTMKEPTMMHSIGKKVSVLGTLLKQVPIIYLLFITLIVVLISVLVFIIKNNRLTNKNDTLEGALNREKAVSKLLRQKYDMVARENSIFRGRKSVAADYTGEFTDLPSDIEDDDVSDVESSDDLDKQIDDVILSADE